MKNVIIAYPSRETAMQLKNVLEENGLYVSHICATGASVLNIASDFRECVIVCAYILRDMSASALYDRLPAGFDIVALSRGGREELYDGFLSLPLPLDRDEFLKTVAVLVSSRGSYTERDKTDADAISDAKLMLMKTNEISEAQAHKYLQRLSMKDGKKLADTARIIIRQLGG